MECGRAPAIAMNGWRRRAVKVILALACGPTLGAPVRAQVALTTPRGSGRTPVPRSVTLPLASDLAADGRASRSQRVPILLFFDRGECPYCERALREYIVPMSRDEWRGRALFRRIDIDGDAALVGLDGKTTTHARIAEHYGVSLSPTVIVVDGDGRRLGDPIVGLLTVDFYGAYLERALEEAVNGIEKR